MRGTFLKKFLKLSDIAKTLISNRFLKLNVDMARYKAAIQKIAFFEEQLVEWQEYWNIALLIKEKYQTLL